MRSKILFSIYYTQLIVDLKEKLNYLHLPTDDFILLSLRNGGATRDFLSRVVLKYIMVQGRWSFLSSCRGYLIAGQSLLLRVQLPRSARIRIQGCAESFENLQ